MSSDQEFDTSNAAQGASASDNDYVNRPGQGDEPVPVQSDDAPVEEGINAPSDFEGGENSDEQLAKDDADAIDESNIVEGKRSTRAEGSMAEPGDEEGLPSDDGTSSGAAQ